MEQSSPTSRGERDFVSFPAPAAWLYDRLLDSVVIAEQQETIARELVARCPRGRLLEVGTGPGRQLAANTRRLVRLEFNKR